MRITSSILLTLRRKAQRAMILAFRQFLIKLLSLLRRRSFKYRLTDSGLRTLAGASRTTVDVEIEGGGGVEQLERQPARSGRRETSGKHSALYRRSKNEISLFTGLLGRSRKSVKNGLCVPAVPNSR
jgi:hypothetical protein